METSPNFKFQISGTRKKSKTRKNVMLNLIQHLTKLRTYETLKQVQGDKAGLFTRPSDLRFHLPARSGYGEGRDFSI
jgi:hypothetical protein